MLNNVMHVYAILLSVCSVCTMLTNLRKIFLYWIKQTIPQDIVPISLYKHILTKDKCQNGS